LRESARTAGAWVPLDSAHTERYAKEIAEMKANPGFLKK
jgi:hypothetical protein